MTLKRLLRFRLSTLIVATLTASALIGINLKPFAFYYPRPPWIEELNGFVLDRKPEYSQEYLPRRELYGWPVPAYPCWAWNGNDNIHAGIFPQWANFWNPGDISIGCNVGRWNSRAIVVDALANLIVVVAVVALSSMLARLIEKYIRNSACATASPDALKTQ